MLIVSGLSILIFLISDDTTKLKKEEVQLINDEFLEIYTKMSNQSFLTSSELYKLEIVKSIIKKTTKWVQHKQAEELDSELSCS